MDFLYESRFNLTSRDVDLLKEALGAAPSLPDTPEVAWGQYIRFLFEPNQFYRFSSLSADKYLFITFVRSLPGREAPSEGEAIMRRLACAWFEQVDVTPEGVIVEPCDKSGGDGELALVTMTCAEISMSAGFRPPVAPTDLARHVEIKHEASFLTHDLLKYRSERVPLDDGFHPWSFLLKDPVELEEDYFDRY